MRVLFHVDDRPVEDVIDAKLYVIPANEPFEVERDIVAEALLNHQWFHGLVEVQVSKNQFGTQYDIGKAEQESAAKLANAWQKLADEYIQTTLEHRVRKNYPPLPPTGAYLIAIQKLGIDLRSHGINLIGTAKDGPADQRQVTHQAQNEQITVLTELVQQQQRQIEELLARDRVAAMQVQPTPTTPVEPGPTASVVEEQEEPAPAPIQEEASDEVPGVASPPPVTKGKGKNKMVIE